MNKSLAAATSIVLALPMGSVAGTVQAFRDPPRPPSVVHQDSNTLALVEQCSAYQVLSVDVASPRDMVQFNQAKKFAVTYGW